MCSFSPSETRRIFLSPFLSVASTGVSSFFLSAHLPQPYVATGHTGAFISRTFVVINMLWPFHIFCSDTPIAWPLFHLVRNSIVHSPYCVIRDPRYDKKLSYHRGTAQCVLLVEILQKLLVRQVLNKLKL